MRVRCLIAGLAVVMVLSLSVPAWAVQTGGDQVRTTALGSKSVKMVDDKFKPKSVAVSAGTKIKWVNKGNYSHTTTGPGWDVTLSPGQSYSHKFKKAGTYSYYCSFHPKMLATVVVTS